MIGKFILLGIVLSVMYFFIPELVIIIIIFIVIYIIYRIARRKMIPEGHRIRHKALRGFLKQKYGKGEGMSLYKELVGELRGRGYR